MDKKIFNVGLIGAGPGIGIYHAKAVHDTEGAKLLWVCDTNPEAVSKMVAEYDVPKTTADYHDVLADPDVDAVIIAVPDQLHRQVIVDTLAAKKHILCEKPLALVREDIDAIIDAVRKSDRVFMVGQICRYTPGFIEAKKRIDAGEIGELTFIESEYAHDYYTILIGNTWRCDPNRNGVVGGACHAVDLLRWVSGEDPEYISAYGTHKTYPDLTPYDDTHVAIMKFPSGTIGKIMSSISAKRDYTMRSVFYGTKGTIITDNTSTSMKVYHMNMAAEHGYEVEEVPLAVNNHNVGGEFADFFDSVVNHKPLTTTVIDGANTIVACLSIIESANTMKPVKPEYYKK